MLTAFQLDTGFSLHKVLVSQLFKELENKRGSGQAIEKRMIFVGGNSSNMSCVMFPTERILVSPFEHEK